jgi:UDP-glucose 4-epimerase
MSTFLVTGGSGYVGQHLVNLLLNSGQKVVSLDLKPNPIRSKSLEAIQGDISDPDFWNSLPNIEFQGLYHLAALKSVSDSFLRSAEYFEVNVSGTQLALNFCEERRIQNFVFTSSAAVYGAKSSQSISESDRLEPMNPYGQSKKAAESLLHLEAKALGISTVTLRCFNIAGATLDNTLDSESDGLVSALIKSSRSGSNFYLNGSSLSTIDGSCIRDYTHVEDVASCHLAAMSYLSTTEHVTNEVVNVCSSRGTSVLEMLHIVKANTKAQFEVIARDPRLGDPEVSVGSNTKARSLFGWSTSHDIESIIRDTLRH